MREEMGTNEEFELPPFFKVEEKQWKETWALRKEPTKAQNSLMEVMSMFGLITAYLVSISPLVAIVLVAVEIALK